MSIWTIGALASPLIIAGGKALPHWTFVHRSSVTEHSSRQTDALSKRLFVSQTGQQKQVMVELLRWLFKFGNSMELSNARARLWFELDGPTVFQNERMTRLVIE